MSNSDPLRLLIVDDEPLARQRLRDLLSSRADIIVVGDAEDGPSAVTAISTHAPDVVLLDIQMPGMDGIRVAEQLPDPAPSIIFITAYDQHAVRAFEVHAVDYVLKPFEPVRLYAAIAHVQRLRARMDKTLDRTPADWRAMLAELRTTPSWLERVAIRLGDRIYYVRMTDVDWIEADGNYVRLHTGPKSHLLRRAIRQLTDELDPRQFARIHRSAIVNIERIEELRVQPDGDYLVVLSTGARLKMLRKYKDGLP
jgi:two-component system, LytTR family, response regulator